MGLNAVIAMVREQEETLVFDKFDERVSWDLASILCDKAREQRLPVAIAIKLGNRLCSLLRWPEQRRATSTGFAVSSILSTISERQRIDWVVRWSSVDTISISATV